MIVQMVLVKNMVLRPMDKPAFPGGWPFPRPLPADGKKEVNLMLELTAKGKRMSRVLILGWSQKT